MQRTDIRRILGATVSTIGLALTACSQTTPSQGGAGGMMGGGAGGMMGGGPGYRNGWMVGYGGPWVPILVVVIVGLMVWIVARRRNKN